MNRQALEQQTLCQQSNSEFMPVAAGARIGIALNTMNQVPINGLRHPEHGNMIGWYIWGGEYSSDRDFFQVLHFEHFAAKYPDLVKFLGLEPGFRFLTDGKHVDIWFDEQVLNI